MKKKVLILGDDLNVCLASHAGQVLCREQLYSQVWENDNN